MGIETYLGNPPQHIVDWIKNHNTPPPAPSSFTRIQFADGTTAEYDWSGEINQQTMIDAGLFDGDEWIWLKEPEQIEIGTDVTSIGDDVFYGCASLTSMIIPDNVQSIGVSLFYYCTGLTSIIIGDGVTSIGDMAFWGCDGLTSVTIGSSVTSIGSFVFESCSGLTSVIFKGKTLSEVQAMQNYSWGITDTSIISVT